MHPSFLHQLGEDLLVCLLDGVCHSIFTHLHCKVERQRKSIAGRYAFILCFVCASKNSNALAAS